MKIIRFALLTALILGIAHAEILRVRDARVSRIDFSGKENRDIGNSRVRDQRRFDGERLYREEDSDRRTFNRRMVRAAEEERQDKAEMNRRVMTDREGRRMESRSRLERTFNPEERDSQNRRMDNRQRSRSLDRMTERERLDTVRSGEEQRRLVRGESRERSRSLDRMSERERRDTVRSREEQRRLVRDESRERSRSLQRDERQGRQRTMRVTREERKERSMMGERERMPLSRVDEKRQEVRARMDDRRVSRVRTEDERREDGRRLSLKDLERTEERRTFVSRMREMSPARLAIGDKANPIEETKTGSSIPSLIFGGAALAMMLMASGKGKKIAVD